VKKKRARAFSKLANMFNEDFVNEFISMNTRDLVRAYLQAVSVGTKNPAVVVDLFHIDENAYSARVSFTEYADLAEYLKAMTDRTLKPVSRDRFVVLVQLPESRCGISCSIARPN
jgi:hypothetical protein